MKTNFERGQLNAQDDLNANFTEIKDFMNKPVLSEVYLADGEDGVTVAEGYVYKLGEIIAKANELTVADLPFEINANKTTITILKDTVLNFSGIVKFHGAGSTDYAYCFLKQGSKNHSFANLGAPSGQTLNLNTGVAGQLTIKVSKGETLTFTLGVRDGKNIFRTSIRSLIIKEVRSI
ncbi:TPA: hypothetical protein OUF21_001608 [Enterococcus faecalis]|nr:hypothetical protein [Enterococcus faecalis]